MFQHTRTCYQFRKSDGFFSRIIFLSILILLTGGALRAFSAETVSFVSSINDAGLGWNSNVNFADTNPQSDFFVKLKTNNKFDIGPSLLGLTLTNFDYFTHSENDLVSLRVADKYFLAASDWALIGELFGDEYIHGDLGTTDTSYNNSGFYFGGEFFKKLNTRADLRAKPGLQYRSFPGLNRQDTTFMGSISGDFTMSPKLKLETFLEVGRVQSSVADYRKHYWDLILGVEHTLKNNWNIYGDIELSSATFPERPISETTVVIKKRGLVSTQQVETPENYRLTALLIELNHKNKEGFRTSFSLKQTTQKSLSGYYDFSVTEILGKFIIEI